MGCRWVRSAVGACTYGCFHTFLIWIRRRDRVVVAAWVSLVLHLVRVFVLQ